ncbi:hypothetical protein PG999_006501 [Apiospora kogelbergensis]|uniref:Uncharacterized protein n=1 Tax=Apiospora kogelbergensis TaxID=1337665 RepID=A0AAW0QS61_9PEZI
MPILTVPIPIQLQLPLQRQLQLQLDPKPCLLLCPPPPPPPAFPRPWRCPDSPSQMQRSDDSGTSREPDWIDLPSEPNLPPPSEALSEPDARLPERHRLPDYCPTARPASRLPCLS